MVDESSDVSNREHVVFCVRWVEENLHSHTDFIGSCSTMMGKKNGVATLIKRDIQAFALSTHCYAHSLNLAWGLDQKFYHWIR